MIGLVSADTDTASVLLSRITTHEAPEDGAILRLQTPHGAVALAASAGDACGLPQGWACYRGAYPEPPRPGDEIRIEGELAGGEPISGTTTVPDPPRLLLRDGAGAPVADTLRSTELRTPFMELDEPAATGWVSIAGGSALADVWVAGARRTCQARVFETFVDLRYSSFAVGVGEPECEGGTVAWDSLALEVRVDAFDASFTSYWERTAGFTQSLFRQRRRGAWRACSACSARPRPSSGPRRIRGGRRGAALTVLRRGRRPAAPTFGSPRAAESRGP
jgi:hypothetical protein